MKRIRSLAPEVCPTCGANRSFHVVDGIVRCVRCGMLAEPPRVTAEAPAPAVEVSDDELEALFGDDAATLEIFDAELARRRESYRPSYIIRHRDRRDISGFSEAVFSTAMSHVERKEWDEAIRHLRRALEYSRDFSDAHLWLARLLPDEASRRNHLKAVLAIDMQHGDALRELMVLDGELSADAMPDEFTMPEVQAIDTVDTQSRGVKCPRCGAPKLDRDPANPAFLTCGACGHEIASAAAVGGEKSIFRAMLKRRAQPVIWKIGVRVLRCNGCGAQRTFAAKQLAELCPFCGSRNVVTQDALNTLTQPDLIIPFEVDERTATAAIYEALGSGFERVKRWFNDNRAYRIMAEGVFLPYWVFDAAVDVTRTYRLREENGRRGGLANSLRPTFTEQFGDAAYNVLIPAVRQPAPEMLGRLGKFDVNGGLAYSPEAIAQYGAEIYTKDFDRAALDAHGVVGQNMRDRYDVTTSSQETVSIFTVVRPISFRLMLLPIWAMTIHERDGDVRPALVNGQTGQVVFGKAVKPAS